MAEYESNVLKNNNYTLFSFFIKYHYLMYQTSKMSSSYSDSAYPVLYDPFSLAE